MKEFLMDFLEGTTRVSHLQPLLKRKLIIFINCEELNIKCNISLHALQVCIEESELPDISIKGSKLSILKLLSGEVPFRKLVSSKELTVMGPYNNVLRFESLCILMKNESTKV
jgi:hypothetical protein